jgi:hypothetical protein
MPPTKRVYSKDRIEHIPERRGVSCRSVIEAAKEAVPIIDLADLLCGPGKMHRIGEEWVARCPLPDHEDRTPSFTVNPEKGLWFCHGCARGGDIVELARFAWGYEKGEVAMAAANILREFGHEIPARPDSWYRKEVRQTPVREQIERMRIEYIRRRAFRVWCDPLLEGIEDPEELRQDAQALWEAVLPVARRIYEGTRR